MDSELNYLHRLLSEKTNIIKLLENETWFLRNLIKAQNEIILKISACAPEGCFEDVKQVKKSVDELTNSVDDRLQSITDMVQEMRRELTDIKKDQNKNAPLSVEEDLYELGNGTQASQGSLLAKESPKPTLSNSAAGAFSPAGLLRPSLRIVSTSANATIPPSKAPPVNVVITSSDPLPSIDVTTSQPVLPVTIPPQHIKGNVQKSQPTPQVSQGTAIAQAHNYQVPLPANKMVTTMPSVLSQPPPLVSTQSLFSNVPSSAFSAIAKGPSPSKNVSLGTQASQGSLLAKEGPKPTLSNSAAGAFSPAGLLRPSLRIVSTSANATIPPSKAPPVNVVITSSDPLPSIDVTTSQPVLPVTIPPQHIKGNVQKSQLTPQVSQGTAIAQANNYQIPLPANKMVTTMPSVLSQPPPLVSTQSLFSNVPSSAFSAIAKGPSPSKNFSLGIQIEKTLNRTFSPNTSINRSNVSGSSVHEYDPRPDFQPIVPLPDEVPVNTGEEKETELFCQRAKLFRWASLPSGEKEWKERGVGNIKILVNPDDGKVRVIMRREKVHKICANHFLTKETSLSPMANNDRAYIWAAHDYADGEIVLEKFCVRFKTTEEARKFADAFELAKTKISDKAVASKKEPAGTPKIESSKPETLKTPVSMTPVTQVNLGGFKFTSTLTFKPAEDFKTTPKVEEVIQKAKEPVHVSPFAGFSFGAKSSATPKHGLDSITPQVTTGFTISATPKHGLDSFSPQVTTKPESHQKDDNDDSAVDDFVPTAKFKPVVDKIPDLVEVKTGEENAEILFDERAKLFRYDTSGEKSEWKERGIGNIKILKENTIRLIMRREQVHKLCLNHQVLKNMFFKQNATNPKAIVWHAQDFSEGVLKPETFSIRFKTEELANKFLRILQSAQTTIVYVKDSDLNNHKLAKSMSLGTLEA